MHTSSTLNVAVASTNPVKLEAARLSFERAFDTKVCIHSINAPSGVNAQPMTHAETRLGALNRVEHVLMQHNDEFDYVIAYEGGIDVTEDGPITFAIICIANQQQQCVGQSAAMPLPIQIYQQILDGKELGTAMDELFNTHNIKQKGGAIGQLTRGLETRQSAYESATILALCPFMNEALYRS